MDNQFPQRQSARLACSCEKAALAKKYFIELLDSVETLGGLADQYGQQTLISLMYLQWAIMNGTVVNIDDDAHAMHEILSGLPSGSIWLQHCEMLLGDWREVPQGSICQNCTQCAFTDREEKLCWKGWPGIAGPDDVVQACKAFAPVNVEEAAAEHA